MSPQGYRYLTSTAWRYPRSIAKLRSSDSFALVIRAPVLIPLRDLLDQLDPQMFWQIHRSTIVNVQAIDSVGRDAVGHVVVRLKNRSDTLRVSQPFAYRFRQM